MRDFRILIRDARRSAPSVYFVQAAGKERARQLARDIMEESTHHLGAEVWEGGILLFAIGEPMSRRTRDATSAGFAE